MYTVCILHLKKKYKNTLIFNPMALLPSTTPYHTTPPPLQTSLPPTHTHPYTHSHPQITEPKYLGQFTAELFFLRKQSAGRGNLAFPLVLKCARDAAAYHTGPDKSLSIADLHFLKSGSGMDQSGAFKIGTYRD